METLNKNFDRFIYGIGGIPSTYLESLSYEEQLMWFCKNLEELISNVCYAINAEDYETLINELNTYEKDNYNKGQTFLIDKLGCPDLWISNIEDEKIEYTYTSDADVINDLETNGYIQVGYFKLQILESYIDLSNYVKFSDLSTTLQDYVTNSSLTSILSSYVTNSSLVTTLQDYVTSSSLSTTLGDYVTSSSLSTTLNDYELKSNKVTSISSSSTDTEYPSAKCVYDIVGDVESLLGAI